MFLAVKQFVSDLHRDSGSGSSSGHRLLLFLSGAALHRLEVVEGRGEVAHQALPLQLLLPLEGRGKGKERIKFYASST